MARSVTIQENSTPIGQSPAFLEMLDHVSRLAPLDRPARDRLMRYEWPGNVRELRNVIERSVYLHGSAGVPAGQDCV